MDSHFATQSTTADGVVAQVYRRASEECADGVCPIDAQLEGCVREAVAAVWDARVKTFVPVLALRRVRAYIRAGTCDCDDF